MNINGLASLATKTAALACLLLLTLFAGGCGDMTGRGPAPLERTVDVLQREQHQRVGYVYCMRGFLGIWSEGMDALADKIDSQLGIPAVSLADEERTKLRDFLISEYAMGQVSDGPLILLGHSYGADDQIRVAKFLQQKGITVDLLVLIDPVTPPAVPENVKRVYCLYYSHPLTDWYPAWRGVPATVVNPAATPIENIDLRTTKVDFETKVISHPTIEKVEGVHKMVMQEIEKTCPTRAVWQQTHPAQSAPIAGTTTPPNGSSVSTGGGNGARRPAPAVMANPIVKPATP